VLSSLDLAQPAAYASDVDDNSLGQYLRALRSSVSPSQVGLQDGHRRRVTGLRRAEVAQLAGLSTEYYVRLEQGRADHPSQSVLEAFARALQLGTAERNHLFDIARHRRSLSPCRTDSPRPALGHVVGGITQFPALIVNRSLDVLAWNPLASCLIADFAELPPAHRNLARHVFLDPRALSLHVDWETAALDSVGMLRMATSRPPVDDALLELIDELSSSSPDFRRLWTTHHVHEKTHGIKLFRHEDVGLLELQYETFLVAGHEHHMMVVYSAEPDSPTSRSLQRLSELHQASSSLRVG